uniref:Adhesion G protein-coupled receptor E2 n=1 Tax=Ailuropoda melanoleuca TaxID=9646 RepID=A0A7N5P4S0_AILME
LPSLSALGLCVLLLSLGTIAQKRRAACARCPRNAHCTNATSCRCDPGFTSLSGKVIFSNPSEICTDINECGPPLYVSCGSLAHCHNVEGSHYCECASGHELLSGGTKFQSEKENTCQGKHPRLFNAVTTVTCLPHFSLTNCSEEELPLDVDECSSGKHQCHNSTHCINVKGSYRCYCHHDWVARSKPLRGLNLTICEERSSPIILCPPSPQTPSSGSLTQPHVLFPQSLSHFFDKVQQLSQDFKPALAKNTIQDLMQEVGELLEIPGDLKILTPSEQHCVATNLLIGLEDILRVLSKFLPNGPLTVHAPAGTELSLKVQEQGIGDVTLGQSDAKMQLNWDVVQESSDFGPSVVGLISMPGMGRLLAEAPLVLDPEKQAVLHGAHKGVLQGVSPVLLSDIISAFMSNRHTQNLSSPVTFIFSHHSVTPGPREEVFCVFWKHGQNGYGHWSTTGCRIVSTRDTSTTCQCTHLSSFAVLMAHYDVQVRAHGDKDARDCRHQKGTDVMRDVRGEPGRVAASRAKPSSSPDKGFIWTFLGPVCTIFSINLAFFLMTFWIVKNKLSSLDRDVSTLQNTRMLTFKATAQLLILGCTWCLGILQVGPAAHVMAYLFTIVNSLQGVFLFLVYCLLSQQVREQYKKWFKGVRKTKAESEKYTLSSGTMSDASKHSEFTPGLT